MTQSIKYLSILLIGIIVGMWFSRFNTINTLTIFSEVQSFMSQDLEGMEVRDFVLYSGDHAIQFIDWKNDAPLITTSLRGDVSLDFAMATEEKAFLLVANETGCRNRVIIFDRVDFTIDEMTIETCVMFLDQTKLIGFQNQILTIYQVDSFDQALASTPFDEPELLFVEHSADDRAQNRLAFFAGEDGPAGHVNLYVWYYLEETILLVDFGSLIPSAETVIRFSEKSIDELILSDVETQTTENRVKIK